MRINMSNPSGLDRDYFELEAAPIPFPVPMPWRCSMDVSFLANPAFLRGLDQTPAGIVLGSDSPVQVSSLDPTSFVSHLQWYGFGKGHRLYWDAGNLDFSRVQGKATWTGAGALAGFAPGDRGSFQVQYRDTQGPCSAGFGAANALQVGFVP